MEPSSFQIPNPTNIIAILLLTGILSLIVTIQAGKFSVLSSFSAFFASVFFILNLLPSTPFLKSFAEPLKDIRVYLPFIVFLNFVFASVFYLFTLTIAFRSLKPSLRNGYQTTINILRGLFIGIILIGVIFGMLLLFQQISVTQQLIQIYGSLLSITVILFIIASSLLTTL
jgi:hypothetical protein